MSRRTVSLVIIAMLLIGILTAAFNVKPVRASGTIYIRADGSIDPSTAPISTLDCVTYTLTDNITSSGDGIIVERDNVIIDGDRHTLQGEGGGNGIYLSDRSNVTIKSANITQFSSCIALWGCFDITLSGNNITGNTPGGFGIAVYDSSNSSIVGNDLEDNGVGVSMYVYSTNNIICANNISQNGAGIWSAYDSNITIANNNFQANSLLAIWMNTSSYCTISGNDVLDNYQGIGLGDSFNNTVSGNNIRGTDLSGIALYESYNNTVYGNIVNGNGVGIRTDIYSSDNEIYRNDIVHNAQQADTYASPNSWDDGYPSGGNFWSDYTGADMYSGPYQNVTGSDGIGDTPYVMDSSNLDNYPLMIPSFLFEGQAIYIRADGNITPSEAPIQRKENSYSLTDNITAYADAIVIERDNIVLDGAGYTVTGSDSGCGITLPSTSNVTVENMTIRNFGSGISLYSSSDNALSSNNITNNDLGIVLDTSCNNNALSGNNIANNHYGIYLYSSSSNTLSNNDVTANNYYGIDFYSSSDNVLSGNNIANNDGGIVLDTSCSNNVLSGNNFAANNYYGIFLYFSSDNALSGNNVTANNPGGIELEHSSSNALSGNNVTANNAFGIWLYSSSGNVLSGNNVSANNHDGIVLDYSSSDNALSGNNVTANNGNGIVLYSSSGNVLSGNNIAKNHDGILLDSSSSNALSGNNVTANNEKGIALYFSSDNSIFHNDFVGNAVQALSENSSNTWDDGYPSGGNYWSDYNGTDLYQGPYQNEIGSDGIGDTPYTIDANNLDNYPLMNPWSPPAIAITNLASAKKVIGYGYTGSMNVTFENLGAKIEAFNATVYVNSTCIHSEQIMLGMTNCTLIFTWNTTGFTEGNYTLWACAEPVSGEISVQDNTLVDGWIKITIVGDVNGDGKVNLIDVFSVALAYGSYPGRPTWNPNYDINNDGKINLIDYFITALNYGKTDS